MAESHERPKKPDSGRAILVAGGFVCLWVFFFGLAEVLWASDSGSVIELVGGLLGMVFGGIGAACVGGGIFTKPTDKPRGEIDKQAVPYGIDERRTPEGDDLEVLLPPQVGPYVRDPIRAPATREQPVYANYRCGSSTVFVELGICSSPSSAKLGLANAKAEMDAEFPDAPKLFVLKGEPAYFKAPTRGFLAWTRGRYYFSASASAGEEELDRFMEAFPY